MSSEQLKQLTQIKQVLGSLSISGEKNIITLGTCLEALNNLIAELRAEIEEVEE